ncbi:MAG: DUF3299 domain-containing protein [Erythrobacter sp.]|uniref:DUF3299 domain-containing protein n=1 Tax=Erythrobacter sp. TaxID=1042 RepID=UPI00260D347B|nr:DUF3299 domain-containing protein [Erythrobacter sp.]MDJ0977736.1 DUF3299 domain-containing protein [Erythrobacter sp.]
MTSNGILGAVAAMGMSLAVLSGPLLAQAPDPKMGPPVEDIWKPAPTPKGGTSWTVLEATQEEQRLDENGFIRSKPVFTNDVKKLEGKRIKVAGWMLPLEESRTQKRFVLLGYPPGCPYHFHAAPNQYIEVFANTPFPTDEKNAHVVSGVLELTGYDESGVFYRLRQAKPS